MKVDGFLIIVVFLHFLYVYGWISYWETGWFDITTSAGGRYAGVSHCIADHRHDIYHVLP